MNHIHSRNFNYTRQATHSGSWYSGDGEDLEKELDEWLEKVDQPSSIKSNFRENAKIRAIIAPHAGYSFSGPTAAYAYAHLDPTKVKRIFILGPSHHVYLTHCAICVAKNLETPLGDLEIDQDVTEELLRTGKFKTMSQDVDEDEHSIEMHLPFIKRRMGVRHFTVVCIMVGSTSRKSEEEYGMLLAPYLADEENFFVISSDFCHWGSRFDYQPYDKSLGEIHEYIHWLDHMGMQLLEEIDLEGFYDYLFEYGNTICGRHPICTFMHAVKHVASNNTSKCSLLFIKYAQSSSCISKRESSVSYASALISGT